MAAAAPALELVGIEKRFGAVHANRAVSVSVAAGSIHAIVGENGAGKSTLMNIVYGMVRADAGDIRVGGRPVAIADSADAIRCGIGMVHQHFMLVEPFSVLENAMLGAEGGAWLPARRAAARDRLLRLAADYGLAVEPDAVVADLPVGARQRVEILKALDRGAEILILDEPTAVLTPQEADNLFRVLAALRAQGKTVILITHKLREVMAAADRVTVMRQGAVVGTFPIAEVTPARLAELMVGRTVAAPAATAAALGPVRLTVDRATVVDTAGVVRVRDVSFSLRGGEIVGIAGVAGNGQSELLEALAGLRPLSAGRILVDGRPLPAGADAVRALGVAHVPEDRLRRGLVASMPVADNSILGYQRASRYGRGPFLSAQRILASCRDKLDRFDVRPRDCKLRAGLQSGGNQQKLVLAREIDGDPDILLVGQPTRGVDIGAIEFIHGRLAALRQAGKAVLLVSAELDEILALADRILVMACGALAGELPRAEATERRLGLMMAGMAAPA